MLQPSKGVTISRAEQGSDEWKQDRLGKFTASRAGDLMLKQKNGKPYATRQNYITQIALERLTGLIPEQVVSDAMQNGIEQERNSALAYSFRTGNDTEQTGFWYTEYYGASPDDLLIDSDGGVEYKNPMPATHKNTLEQEEIPPYYYWQILQCMLVTKADYWDYVSHCAAFPVNAKLFIKRLHSADVKEDLELLRDELALANKEVEEQVNFIKNYKEK